MQTYFHTNTLHDWVNYYLTECRYVYFQKYVNEKIFNLCSKYLLSDKGTTDSENEILISFFTQTFKPNQKIN